VDPVLEIADLEKEYPGQRALDGVSLTIQAGEIFALLGPNGAGKTTLIGCVTGLVAKSRGRIRLFGTDLDVEPVRPRYSVGLVPQEINFDPFFTAREALELQLGYYGLDPDPARVAEVLEAMDLTAKADTLTRALSGGMRRRLLIAKALVHRPRLVFLDEPTAGVDVELRRDLWAYVEQLKRGGTTVVLTTHYLEEAEALADRVGVIDHGRLLVVEEKASLMRRLGERRLVVHFTRPVSPAPAFGELAPDGRCLTFVERPPEAAPGAPRAVEVLQGLFAAGLPIAEVAMEAARLEDVILRVLASSEEAPR
jgi:ABC-2 type transport system ATP-binding protein